MKRNVLLARLVGLAILTGVAALGPRKARAAAITGNVTFGDAKISVVNAETNWVDGDLLLVYTNSAASTPSFTLPGIAQARFVVVGGGGAGGSLVTTSAYDGGAGGGGAGGYLDLAETTILKGTYTISLGVGGKNAATISATTQGANGSSTLITTNGVVFAEAYGGGGGGAKSNGSAGGSGGGASMSYASRRYNPMTGGAASQGCAGGDAKAAGLKYGAGGGGAGAVGEPATNQTVHAGGAGILCDIAGKAFYIAGGGGGGNRGSAATGAAAGGVGGGGAGAKYDAAAAVAGADGLGGGGGGGGVNDMVRGANGGSGGVFVRISMALAGPLVPPSPTTNVYDGTEHVFVKDTFAYSVEGGKCSGTNVGTYTAVLRPQAGLTWEDGGDPTGTREVEFVITKAQAVITDLVQKGWKVGTAEEDTPDPTCTVNFCAAGEPTYTYAKVGSSAFSAEKPTELGSYQVKATVADDAEHGNYVGTSATAKFAIYNDPKLVFTDYVEITNVVYTGTSPKELTNFPYCVTLANNEPLGFLYSRAGLTGENLAFTDADGNLLEYEVETWNVKGTSTLYVKVPLITSKVQTIYLYWSPQEGLEVPEYDPDTVWSNWTKGSTAWNTAAKSVKTPSFNDVVKGGKIVNYWKVYPAMDKTEWNMGDEPGKITVKGQLAHGTVTNTIVNSLTGDLLEEIPDEGGVYRLSFMPVESGYETPEFHIDVRIVEHVPWDDLGGGGTNLTLNGRVLLANDDSVAGHAVTDQGYWQKSHVAISRTSSRDFNPFWVHEDSETVSAFANLKAGFNHIFCETNVVGGVVKTNILWTLSDVLIGSTAAAQDISSSYSYCYLPYSSTSKKIGYYSTRNTAATRIDAGTMVMRNVDHAAIYSQCYTNGIGTVYFDAVNTGRYAPTSGTLPHRSTSDDILEVQVATETTDGLPPTDENAKGDLANNLNWRSCPLVALVRDNGVSSFTALPEATSLALVISTGASDKNFYRVCARIEARGLARFRIVRTGVATGYTVNEGGCFITLDNILVSYPRNAANLTTCGTYDETLKGINIVGWGNATETPFPAITGESIVGRGLADVYMSGLTNADPSTFIQLSRLHYRWRYLNQQFGDWKTVDLRPADNFVAENPLDVPLSVGDVEYWYETFTQMPYYKYFDYSGTGDDLKGADGNPLYSEESAIVTNVLDLATVGGSLPGNNTNWFFRLREAASDLERMRVIVKRSATAAEESIDLSLSADNCWRGYVRTETSLADGLFVRFEAINAQTPGMTGYATNKTYYALREDITTTTQPDLLVETSGTNTWSTVVCDAKTGGLMIQVQADTKAVTVVHADFQDFNAWSDANKQDGQGLFVGRYEYNEAGASGSNPSTHTYEDLFKTWHLSNAANTNYWSEPFNIDVGQLEPGKDYAVFTSFTGTKLTPNRFTTGPGMWVTRMYRDKTTGLALQMQGQGKGYLQFVNAAESPRGLDSVSFKTRLGQSISFTDFSYYMGGCSSTYTNYTFTSRAAYDLNGRNGFSGNGSLSLVGFYQPGWGAYELRVEQENANNAKTGPGITQRLTLYRWRFDSTKGGVIATSLGTMTVSNDAILKTAAGSSNYGVLFMSIMSTSKDSGGITKIRAGVSLNTAAAGNTTAAAAAWVGYNDTDPDLRLKWGSYGVLSANCPGRFVVPIVFVQGQPAQFPSGWSTWTTSGFKSSSNYTFYFPSVGKRTCYDEIFNDQEWAVMPWRMTKFGENQSTYGLLADPLPQPLNVYTAPSGSTDWSLVATTNISSFGSMEPMVFHFYTKEDCSVKIAPGGDDDTVRSDVVVDDFEITQWRGESYDDSEGTKYFNNVRYGSPTNFVFTQAWIMTNSLGQTNCQLNARRSLSTVATSVRSPLMDGQDGRGVGLGMLTFTYANAQPNVNLLLQIATNGIDITTLADASKSVSDSTWTTVTNFSFATASAAELKSGQLSYYLGLHGTKGVMRLVMDPKVVTAVESETDPGKFGSIDITGILCRDEPELDETSWWGWNLRTTADASMMNIADVAAVGVEDGLVLGLNNSITDETRGDDAAQYAKHFPFVQTPLFGLDVIGEVTFKARKYDPTDPAARVTLYGQNGISAPDNLWVKLASWQVTNTTYQSFSFKTAPGENYKALRFAVTGVEDVADPKMPDPDPLVPAYRVLLDDVMVLEAVRTRVGFRHVAAFRNHLDTREVVGDIMDRSEQPLCKEAWGVQTEIYAAQLADEVDLSSAKVRLWWYEGTSPWGFDNWKSKGSNAWLATCDGTNLIFRSSYFGAQRAVMSAQQRPTTVQYMLEVQYRTKKGEATTNWLEQADWPVPSWYNPIDYNARYGGSFSAFNLLDTVSPGWAWINEVNIYGEMDANYNNSDKPLQFVEIAAPSDADLTDWSLRFLYCNSGSQTIITNDVATFGQNGLPGIKAGYKGMDIDSSCVFHVIGSPYTLTSSSSKPLTVSDGTLDGTWRVKSSTSAYGTDGEISRGIPFGIQLIRPSGVIASEIVAIGTNRWAYLGGDYLASTQVDMINAAEKAIGGQGLCFDVGMDCMGIGTNGAWSTSLGCTGNYGDSPLLWSNTMGMTPGRMNELQYISGQAPKPMGVSYIVYSQIDGDHLYQTFADAEMTNLTVAAVVPMDATTNITYHADRWYQVGSITTNGVVISRPAAGTRDLVVKVGGRGISNDFTVVAHSVIDGELETKYGLDASNPYRAAVMDWLTKGKTKRGDFANKNTSGELVGLGSYTDWSDKFVTNLTLTTMYWLDMDPTWNPGPDAEHAGDMRLKAQIGAPTPIKVGDLKNVRVTMSMMITNANEEATDKAWAPYILQGRDPAGDSWSYASATSPWTWTNETFKITGILANSHGGGDYSRNNWLPLRSFVFGGTEGGVSTSFDANFSSVIDIIDPHSTESPGYYHGWHDSADPVWNRWDLDNRLVPMGVEVLKPDMRLSE